MKHDRDLIKQLYQKHMYQDARGLNSRKTKVLKEYEELTGRAMSASTYERCVRTYDKERMFEERDPNVVIVNEPTHVSERYIEIPTSELLDPEDIIRLHGMNPETMELVTNGSTRSKIGSNNEDGYLINTYSKANFKPKQFRLTKDISTEMLEKVFKDTERIKIEPLYSKGKGMMLIPLKDMHFGLSTYEEYKPHQSEIYKYIISKEWEEINFIIGSDLFQTNDSYGRTVLGTQVDFKVSLYTNMNDARKFYVPLIEASLEQAQRVNIYYEGGNHDKDTSLLFVTALEWLYPNVNFIIKENKPYQGITFHNVFIGTHHGDIKSNPKLVAETFIKYFGLEIAKAKYKEVLIGHKHHLWSEQHMNMLIQGLSTATKDSEYDYTMGFGKGHKAFVIRVYSENSLKMPILINGEE